MRSTEGRGAGTRAFILLLVVASLASEGCARTARHSSEDDERAPKASSAGVSETGSKARRRPAPPFSAHPLPSAEYGTRGVPPASKRYGPKEYEAAGAAMRRLRPEELPRLDQPSTRALFERLVAEDNLVPLRDGSRPPAHRLSEANALLFGVMSVGKIYLDAMAAGLPFDFEQFRLIDMACRTIVEMNELMTETLRRGDDKTLGIQSRGTWLAKTTEANGDTLSSLLGHFEEVPDDHLEGITDLAQRSVRTVPRMLEFVTPLNRKEALKRIEAAKNEAADPALRRALQEILEACGKNGAGRPP